MKFPAIITLDDERFSQNHYQHWQLLSQDTAMTLQWIHQALDEPSSPMGLCPNEQQMNPHYWLIQGPSSSKEIVCSQVHAVEQNIPQQLKHAFPSLHSPYRYAAKIKHIVSNQSGSQAILCLDIKGNTVYAFDNLYVVNQEFYQPNQSYDVYLSAWAYQLEEIPEHETVVIDDPEAIRHHRALNDILAQHNGQTPDDLQEQILAWTPKTEQDQQPITIDISKTIAYLYGDELGQEDEAWFQGKIVGKTHTTFMHESYTLYDIILIDCNETPDQEKILFRVATKHPDYQQFTIGQYIRGDIWLQAHIFTTSKGKYQQF